MITRDEAFVLIKKYLKDENNIRHSIAVEALLREMARRLGKDKELWGLTGLLHNIDYEFTIGEPQNRGNLSAQILTDLIPEVGVNAIKANNYLYTECIPVTSLDKALIAADATAGLIIATANLMPSKKIFDVTTKTLFEKFKDQSFATRYSRSRINLCTDNGIELEDFLIFSLSTLKEISDEIGL